MKSLNFMLENTEICNILGDLVPEREMRQHDHRSNLDGGLKFKPLQQGGRALLFLSRL